MPRDMAYTAIKYMERGDSMALAELPMFIVRELSGPYGPYETDRINRIHEYYSKYAYGSDFKT